MAFVDANCLSRKKPTNISFFLVNLNNTIHQGSVTGKFIPRPNSPCIELNSTAKGWGLKSLHIYPRSDSLETDKDGETLTVTRVCGEKFTLSVIK